MSVNNKAKMGETLRKTALRSVARATVLYLPCRQVACIITPSQNAGLRLFNDSRIFVPAENGRSTNAGYSSARQAVSEDF